MFLKGSPKRTAGSLIFELKSQKSLGKDIGCGLLLTKTHTYINNKLFIVQKPISRMKQEKPLGDLIDLEP